jgi:hypothetical protein
MPKTRDTPYATFYDSGNGDAAMIAALTMLGQNVADAVMNKRKKKDQMKEVWVSLSPDQQQQLYSSWSDKDKKFYGVKPRAKTAVEEATEAATIAQSEITQTAAKNQPLLTAKLQQEVDAGKISLEDAQIKLTQEKRQEEIIANKEGKYSPYEQALLGHGLRGEEADRFVIGKTHPDLVEEIILDKAQKGPKFQEKLTGEYFQKLVTEQGGVDPKYTLPTAKAMAKAFAGDTSELDKLSKDPKWPKSMQTLAFKNYMQDQERLNRSIAESKESDRRVRGQLTISLMQDDKSGNIGPNTAAATVDAIMNGTKPPDWTKPQWDRALEQKTSIMQAEVAKRSFDLAKEVSGIPEIRSAMDSIRQLQAAEVGDSKTNAAQIEGLKKQMLSKMQQLYHIDPVELEKPDSMWSKVFNATVGYLSTGTQFGIAVAGDAVKGLAAGDPLIDELMKDAGQRVSPGGVAPTGRQVNLPGMGQSSITDMLPSMPTPQATHPSTRAVPGNAPLGKSAVLKQSADRLVSEYAAAPPERKIEIRRLLEAIKAHPDFAGVE